MVMRKTYVCLLSIFVFCAFFVCENGALGGILDGVPKAISLPECTSGDSVVLVPLDTAGKPVTIELLGGTTAFPAKVSTKKKKNPEDDLVGFTLEKEENKENSAVWKIKYNQRGKVASAALLTHDGKELKFRWNLKVPAKFLAPLGNCVLKITVENETHYLALRKAVVIESLVLNPKTAAGSIRSEKLDCPFPSLETVYVEILNLGQYQAGGTDVVIPPATKAFEIGPKNPLQIKFNFTDSNNNVQTAVQLDVLPGFGNNFTASLIPAKELAKQLPIWIQQANDPQIDIQINNWKKDIQARKKELADKPGWQGDAKKTTEITQKEMQIWMVGKLKTLSDADAQVRVYIDYGETQTDLVTTEKMTVEQIADAKKASRKSSSKKGSKGGAEGGDGIGGESGESGEDGEDGGGKGGKGNDFGGMKF